MNQFGSISNFNITVSLSKDKKHTIIKDSFFTSPFKIMKPFENSDGSISVYQQTASAGIMAGDQQSHKIKVETGARLKILSQSFEKIFKMEDEESAERNIHINVEKNSLLDYSPLPCIPFSQSNFKNTVTVELEDNTSQLIYKDIICSGRIAHGESFDYKAYRNFIEVKQKDIKKIIFRDNTVFKGSNGGKNPQNKINLQSPVIFSGYTHLGSMMLFNIKMDQQKLLSDLKLPAKLLYTQETLTTDSQNNLIAITRLSPDSTMIKILSNNAEEILKKFESIKP